MLCFFGVFFFLLLLLLSGALAPFSKVNVNTGFSPGWTAGENKDLLTECAQLKGWTVAKQKGVEKGGGRGCDKTEIVMFGVKKDR